MTTTAERSGRGLLRSIFYGPSELRAGWRLFAFLALVLVLAWVQGLLVWQFMGGVSPFALYLIRSLLDFLAFVLASWVMGRFEGRTLADYGLPWRGMLGGRLPQGLLLGFGLISGLLVVMRVVGVFSFGMRVLHGSEIWKSAISYFFVFLLVALREEFTARGYALYTLGTGIGFWPAAILSSVYFGGAHFSNSGETWIGLGNASAVGLLLCLLLRRTGSLWMSIGLHLAFDWGQTYFYGVPDSGQTLPGHLLQPHSMGAVWLSGGSVGPEGSILCTGLVLFAALLCARWLPAVQDRNPQGDIPAIPPLES